MITVYSDQHALHAAPHEFVDGRLGPPHESPQRAEMILVALAQAGYGPIIPPREFGRAPVAAVHDAGYLEYLEHAYARWVAAGGAPEALLGTTLAVRWMGSRSLAPLAAPGYYCFDLSAPIVAGTYQAARAAADVALTGAELLLEGQRYAYALCRPPGHHAGSDLYGGYCYLNNAAIAAHFLAVGSWELGDGGVSPQSPAPNPQLPHRVGRVGNAGSSPQSPAPSPQLPHRVAVLDIDFHHGNGTQQIFYERDDVLFVSIHADPAREYPYFAGYAGERGAGAGLGHNLNLPLPAGVDDAAYLDALDTALQAIADASPRYLVLSAGFDTFGGDPLGDFALTGAAYPAIGRRIAELGLPTLVVQEGGYAVAELGHNLAGLLGGMLG